MEKHIIEQLKNAKTITPRFEFTEHSFRLITAVPQKAHYSLRASLRETVTLGAALVLASLLLVLLLGGFSTNEPRLANEAPGFDITIGQAEYLGSEEQQHEVAMRLERLEESIRDIGGGNTLLLYEVGELKRALTQ